MKFPRLLASTMLAAGMLAGPPAAFAVDPPQPAPIDPAVPAVAPENPPAANPADPLSAIRNAPDPSAAVEAYARARTANADPVGIEKAYVDRLVALGLPELAESQARDLTHRRPDDGVAWAVVAYMDARRGDTSTAMADIVTAAHLAPDDPFVLRTTGQVAAYYDRNAERVNVQAGVKTAFDDVRKAAAAKDAYTRAYREASDAYAQPNQQDSGPAPSAAPYPTPAPSNAYYDSYYNRGGYYDGGYVAPYAYPDPYSYGYAYPGYAWWPSSWWWGSSVVFFNDSHHHHDDHHDGHHDGHDGHHDGNHSHGGSFDHNHSDSFHGNSAAFHGNSASSFRGNSASSFHGNSASSFHGNASSFARTATGGSSFRGVQRGFSGSPGMSGRSFSGGNSSFSTPASRLGMARSSPGGGSSFRGGGSMSGGRSFSGGGGMHGGGGGGMHGGGGGGGMHGGGGGGHH